MPAPPVVAVPVLRHRAPSSAPTHNVLSLVPLQTLPRTSRAREKLPTLSLARARERDDQVQPSPGFTAVIFSSAVHGPLFKHLSTRTRQPLTVHSTSNQPLPPVLLVLLLQGFDLSPVFFFFFFCPLYTYLLFYKFSCRVFWHIPWIFF